MPSIRFNQLEMQLSLEYWTPARMANARPAPLLHVEMPERRQQQYDAFSKAETEMAFCASADESYQHVPHNTAPAKKAGRLYYKSADGEDFYATAQLVQHRDLLLTAAHCLKIPGRKDGWSTNLLFDRGYNNKEKIQQMPLVARSALIPDGWEDCSADGIGRIKWDYAFLKTTCRRNNHGMFNLSLCMPLALKAIGYPKNGGNNNAYMCYVDGIKGENRDNAICMYGNYMDEGGAGGGWFSYDFGHAIYGINSTTDERGIMYGPVFKEDIFNLLCQTFQHIPRAS